MTRKITTLATTVAKASSADVSTAQKRDEGFRAGLASMNVEAAGRKIDYMATRTASDDPLTIRVEAKDTAPAITHLQHVHGFTTGDGLSVCPTADVNTIDDDIIYLIEIDPIRLEIVADSYPVADDDSRYIYEQSVSLPAMQEAFTNQLPGKKFDFWRRVIFLHSVPEETDFPKSVQSLANVMTGRFKITGAEKIDPS